MNLPRVIPVLIAALLLGMVCCAPPVAVPRPIVPTPPSQSASISPAVETARLASGKTAAASERLERQVDALKKSATDLQDGMADAVLEADRLRKKKSATEAELESLWQQLTKLQQRNLFLEIEVDTAVQYAIEQKALRTVSESRVTALTQLAADRDAEVTALRSQHADMAKTIQDQAAAYDQQAAISAKHATRADKSAGTISSQRRVILILGILILLSVGLNVIQFKTGIL